MLNSTRPTGFKLDPVLIRDPPSAARGLIPRKAQKKPLRLLLEAF